MRHRRRQPRISYRAGYSELALRSRGGPTGMKKLQHPSFAPGVDVRGIAGADHCLLARNPIWHQIIVVEVTAVVQTPMSSVGTVVLRCPSARAGSGGSTFQSVSER